MSNATPAGVRKYLSFWAMYVDKYGEPSEPDELRAFGGEGAEEMARYKFNQHYQGGLSWRVFASKWECERAVEAVTVANAAVKLQKQFGASNETVKKLVEFKVNRNEQQHRYERAKAAANQERLDHATGKRVGEARRT